MRVLIVSLMLAFAGACDMLPGQAVSTTPRHIVIGLDLSKSNPLVINQLYASKVGKRIGGMIEDLPMKSKVTLRTFGVYNATFNTLRLDRQISRRDPAENVAEVVEGLISGVPQLVNRGTLTAQNKTNILSFLDNMGQIVDCSEMETIVILASDGIEDSELARQTRDIERLPAPEGAPFQGCKRLEILGLGQGINLPSVTARLRRQWKQWAQEAGFEEFRGLNDW
ncbi:MAG: hypothetical protein ACLFWF_05805 [Alphaproteobacteria bacterium]